MFLINREEVLLGAPYDLNGICKIYQLTLDEICLQENSIGLTKYNQLVSLLTMELEDITEIFEKKGIPLSSESLENMSVFEYFMQSAAHDKSFFLELQKGLSTFIKEEILISTSQNQIIVGNPLERRVIGEEEFNELANVLRIFNRMRVKEPPPENETPMQKRFRLKREQRERIKERQSKKGDENGPEFADLISSLCTMGLGITIFNIKNLTIYQIKDQLERAQVREKYYTELDMLMAGADSKKIKPIHYVRNLLKEVN